MSGKKLSLPDNADDPLYKAGYDHVESMRPKADHQYAQKAVFDCWHGWALREAFWKGALWERERYALPPEVERLVNAVGEYRVDFKGLSLDDCHHWDPEDGCDNKYCALRPICGAYHALCEATGEKAKDYSSENVKKAMDGSKRRDKEIKKATSKKKTKLKCKCERCTGLPVESLYEDDEPPTTEYPPLKVQDEDGNEIEMAHDIGKYDIGFVFWTTPSFNSTHSPPIRHEIVDKRDGYYMVNQHGLWTSSEIDNWVETKWGKELQTRMWEKLQRCMRHKREKELPISLRIEIMQTCEKCGDRAEWRLDNPLMLIGGYRTNLCIPCQNLWHERTLETADAEELYAKQALIVKAIKGKYGEDIESLTAKIFELERKFYSVAKEFCADKLVREKPKDNETS